MLHLTFLLSLHAEELCVSGFGAEVREPALMTQGRCIDFAKEYIPMCVHICDVYI
jgi:hypothetical protein